MAHAVITGGTGGLGKSVAAELRQAGWSVEAPGSKDLDVRDGAAVRRYFQDRETDLLVCCAGIIRDAPLLKLGEENWDQVIEVNYAGAKRCAEAAFPGMVSRGVGHVVFVSSHSAVRPPEGQAAYAAAKASLIGLATSLADRHGRSGIRVNVILPGFLETPMTSEVTPARRDEILGSHVLGQFNTPGAVAAFIRFLHENLPHTSGQIFALDNRPLFPLGDI